MQQFHIREAVVFEDIVPEDAVVASGAMALTRVRMSLQQMLDDPPEDTSQITQTCQDYSKRIDAMIEYMRQNRHANYSRSPSFTGTTYAQTIRPIHMLVIRLVMVKHVIASTFEEDAMKTLETDESRQ